MASDDGTRPARRTALCGRCQDYRHIERTRGDGYVYDAPCPDCAGGANSRVARP